MANIPKNKPMKNIKAGDVISAKWLNKVKNSENISVTAPLTMTQGAFGKIISHGEHGPAVRWGSVISDYVWSDTTYVEVYPMLYTETSNGITSRILSSDDSTKIKVYVTNPIASDVSLVSDITKGITLESNDIISYMWFGQRCGTMMGGGGVATNTDTDFPYVMLPSDLNTLAAQSDTFTDSATASDDSVSFPISRTVWNGTDGALERYTRIITVPLNSGIILSAETNTVIDTAEDCDADVTGVGF